jgi:hypothetical protein
MARVLLIIFAFTAPTLGFLTKGPFFLKSKSGNVETLIIINDTISPEIQKIKKIGELCNIYLSDSEFKNVPVFIWYGHFGFDRKIDSIYLSYDKGNSKFLTYRNKYRRTKLLKNDGIVIRIINSNIDSQYILQLLDYGLHNKAYIKENQKKASYTYWTWQSLPRKELDRQLSQFKHSQKIDSILIKNKY